MVCKRVAAMPQLEVSTYFHQMVWGYAAVLSCYAVTTQILIPRTFEPKFVYDYMLSQFKAITARGASIASPAAATTAATPAFFKPTAGKVPRLDLLNTLRNGGGAKTKAFGAALGLMSLRTP